MQSENWASEAVLTNALRELLEQCDQHQVDLLLIGAFAVRAYAPNRRRLTTDLDFVVSRSSQNSLASILESLGYEYTHRARFGGSQAVKFSKGRKIQIDVSIEQIYDMSAEQTYSVPSQAFREKTIVQLSSTEGGTAVSAYALPLPDLLITKLMTSRPHDAADVIVLVAEGLSTNVVNEVKNNIQKAHLEQRINERLGELIGMSNRELRALTANFAGESIPNTFYNKDFRRKLRQLRTP